MNDATLITLDSVIKQSEGQVSTEIDGEIVLMSIEKGSYYGMNPILSRIWKLIEMPIPVSELCSRLMAEYNVSLAQCQTDVLESLEQLRKQNLIVIG